MAAVPVWMWGLEKNNVGITVTSIRKFGTTDIAQHGGKKLDIEK